jgi:hypothetical protein
MASGFSSAAFDTGLLGNINNQYAQERQNQQRGQEEIFRNFQEASKEYDTAKAKASDEKNEIDALSNTLTIPSGYTDLPSDAINKARLATARDSVELGYNKPEHAQYRQEAFIHTLDNVRKNPDAWNVALQNSKVLDQDTNPQQTAILRKFGDQRSQQDIENVRQHNVNQVPYSNLPGASFGDYQSFQNKAAQGKSEAEEKGKVAGQNSGYDPFAQDTTQAANSNPVPPTNNANGQPNQANTNEVPPINASELQSPQQPSTSSGIQLPGPAPQEQVLPSTGTAASELTAGVQSSPNKTEGEARSGISLNWDYLHSLPKATQPTVQGIAEGRINIADVVPRGMGAAQAQQARQKWFDAVERFDPSFDETTYKARQTANSAVNNPNGKFGQSVVSTNRIAQHLDLLDREIDKLPNMHSGEISPLTGPAATSNKIYNWMAELSGNPAYSKFNQYRTAVAQEAERLWRGTGGASGEIQERMKDLDSAKSPEQLHAAVSALVGLIHGQIDPLQDQKDKLLGPHTSSIMSPKTRAIFDRLAPEYAEQNAAPIQPQQQSSGTFGKGETPDYSHLWSGQ